MEEKTKICPFCREEISVLARKCKYCGEMVGDPLQTERKLTIDDIGRPEQSKEVHGETLVKAYQALQAELKQKTQAIQMQKKRSPLGIPHAKQIGALLVVAGIVAALVVFRDDIARFARQRRANAKDAQALQILKDAYRFKASGDLIGALRSTNEALAVYSESKRAQELLRDLRAEVKGRLEQRYRRREYDRVINFADQAISVDPQNAAGYKPLANLAQEDKSRYALWLVMIMKDENGKCVAAIRTYTRGQVNVSEGDGFMDMRVLNIDEENRQVHLFDDKRGVQFRLGKEGCVFETTG